MDHLVLNHLHPQPNPIKSLLLECGTTSQFSFPMDCLPSEQDFCCKTEVERLSQEVANLYQIVKDMQAEIVDLRTLVSLDPLTEVNNRRAFDKTLLKEWQCCRRQNKPLSILMIDIDHFKKFNDTHGHIAGDIRLVQVARAITSVVKRPGDTVARYGGEEFAVILPDTSLAGAAQLAKQILAAVRAIGSSVSIGIASEIPGRNDPRYRRLLHRADKAMYEAKRQGRNRFIMVMPTLPASKS